MPFPKRIKGYMHPIKNTDHEKNKTIAFFFACTKYINQYKHTIYKEGMEARIAKSFMRPILYHGMASKIMREMTKRGDDFFALNRKIANIPNSRR